LAFAIHCQEDTRIGATGAYRSDQRTFGEDYRLSGHEIGGSYSKRNAQLLEDFHFQDAVQESGHAVIGAKAESRDGIASEVFEADDGGNLFEFFGRDAAAVGR